jgi:hypothetical protein
MAFVHLERDLWDPRDRHGREITQDVPETAPRRSSARTPAGARCADSTIGSATTRSLSKQRTCDGIARDGLDDLANVVGLCSLRHALFDCGVLGLSPNLQITVSSLYVATSQAGRDIGALAGQLLLHVRPGQPFVDVIHINWHTIQVVKATATMPHKYEV